MSRKKKKRKLKKISFDKKVLTRNLKVLFIVALCGVLIFGGLRFFTQLKNSKLNIEVTFSENQELNALSFDTRELIKSFFVSYYSSLARLTENDIKAHFDQSELSSYENAALNQLALSALIEIRLASNEALTFKNAQITLKVLSVEEENGSQRVNLTESHAIEFDCLNGEKSYSCGISHTFVMPSAGAKVLYSHKDESIFSGVEYVYNAEKSEREITSITECDIIASTADAMVKKNIATFSGVFDSKRQNFNANPEKFVYSMETNQPYDREKAVAYAQSWCGTTEVIRNPEYGVYDDIGGNCNNFVSQCIYAAGIPFDTDGSCQWKYYSDELNEGGGDWGRSTSWTDVASFFDYCDENEQGGIASMTGCNFYSGEKGDIIQIASEGVWVHSVIITDVIKDKNGDVLDYVICSNTVDRKNYPLNAYGVMYSMRLIKIFGSYQSSF